jgi:tRNA threonylcarbamoyl adenosine modification protein YeaZ
MKCLAVNTATKLLSIALVDGDDVKHLFETPEMRDQGNVLLGHVKDGLAQNKISFFDLDLLAVVTGPGSFTGIRLGLATMRGIALAADKPLIGMSSFDMFAVREPDAANIVAVESWREQLYFGLLDSTGSPLTEYMNETPEIFLQRALPFIPANQKIVISGDAKKTVTHLFERAALADKDNNAVDVARLAIQKFKSGTTFEKPLPFYLREADVTISSKTARTLKD